MPDRIGRRFGSERSLGIAVIVFALMVAVAVALAAWALVNGFRTESQVQNIVTRVIRIERPTPRQFRQGIDLAISNLTRAEAQRIINKLPRSERRRLYVHLRLPPSRTPHTPSTRTPSGRPPVAHAKPPRRTGHRPPPPMPTSPSPVPTVPSPPPPPPPPPKCLVDVLNVCVPSPLSLFNAATTGGKNELAAHNRKRY